VSFGKPDETTALSRVLWSPQVTKPATGGLGVHDQFFFHFFMIKNFRFTQNSFLYLFVLYLESFINFYSSHTHRCLGRCSPQAIGAPHTTVGRTYTTWVPIMLWLFHKKMDGNLFIYEFCERTNKRHAHLFFLSSPRGYFIL